MKKILASFLVLAFVGVSFLTGCRNKVEDRENPFTDPVTTKNSSVDKTRKSEIKSKFKEQKVKDSKKSTPKGKSDDDGYKPIKKKKGGVSSSNDLINIDDVLSMEILDEVEYFMGENDIRITFPNLNSTMLVTYEIHTENDEGQMTVDDFIEYTDMNFTLYGYYEKQEEETYAANGQEYRKISYTPVENFTFLDAPAFYIYETDSYMVIIENYQSEDETKENQELVEKVLDSIYFI